MQLDREFQGVSESEAVFYARLGLQLEVVTLANISDWVDAILLREETPSALFLDLYRRLHTDKSSVLTFLGNTLPIEVFSVRPVLGWLQQLFAAGSWPLQATIRAMYRLRTLVESETEVGWIYGLAAEYERSPPYVTDALHELYLETQAFLGRYHDYTFANRSQWLYLDAVLPERLAHLRA